ncbi:MAG: hypothetical protein DRP72_00900 [Candidatus Omnitrophota bacterium]|nr:MAG: hypothetical protein DRP72_00900 [Candidatus Omnitrophota bacterium]
MEDRRNEFNYQLSFSKDVSINFIVRFLTFVIVSITSIIIARVLGPKGKGIYSLVITVSTIVATLISMGINFSNIYFIGKKRYAVELIVSNAFFYSIFFGGGITLIFSFLVPFFAPYFLKDATYTYFYLALPIIPLLLIFENIYYILLGFREMFRLAVVSLIRLFFYFATVAFFYYFSKLSIYRVLVAYILGLTISIGVGIYFFLRSGYLSRLLVNKKIFTDSLKFGFKQHLGTIFQFLNYRLDLLIIAALLSPSQVGLYSVAVLVGETIWYISSSIGQILYPKTASSDKESANRFTPLVCRSNVLLTLVAVLILYSVARIVIPGLFTARFLPSVMALRLLLPGIFFLSISKVLGSDLVGRGFPHYNSFASFVSLVVTIILDFLLIPRFGINGASVATSIAYMIHSFTILYLFKKISGVRLYEILIFKIQDMEVYKRILCLSSHKN